MISNQILSQNNNPSSSNLHRMISIKKLYKEGKMYMNSEEIKAI